LTKVFAFGSGQGTDLAEDVLKAVDGRAMPFEDGGDLLN
jgi:hypothetical protein